MCSREKFIVIHIIEQEESEKYADQKYISKLYKYHVLISNFILSRSASAPSGETRNPPFENSPISTTLMWQNEMFRERELATLTVILPSDWSILPRFNC